MSNWKESTIKINSSVKEALQLMNDTGNRLIFIYSGDFYLEGVLSDGDIRRAALKNINLEESVDKIMNNKPIAFSNDSKREEVLDYLLAKDILAAPIIDKANKIIEIIFLSHKEKFNLNNNSVFIMAGGFGTRLKPLTDECPKPMLKIGEKPMLENLILSFKRNGFSNFFVSTHFMPELIHDHFGDGSKLGVNINYLHEQEPLGTAGSLSLLLGKLPDSPMIVINADIVTNLDFNKLLSFHDENKASATMCVRDYEHQIPYGVINTNGIKANSLTEKPIKRYFINAGIYIINPDVIKKIEHDEIIDMPTLLERVIADDDNVLVYPIYDYWLDVGQHNDFEKAKRDILNYDIYNKD
tara:strand:+ start:4140 stop:5204 length:1065 start_codon:yes stop_codon:yes gene_type:complete